MSQDKLPFKNLQTKKISQYAVFAVVGVAFLLLASFYPDTKTSDTNGAKEVLPNPSYSVKTVADEIAYDESALEGRLEEILGQVAGVGQVEARVYLSSTAHQEFAMNGSANTRQTEEQDKNGGNRNITENTKDAQVVMTNGQGGSGQVPVVVKATRAQVDGVVVVAAGADDPTTKVQLTKTVQTLLDIPSHRISVLPMEGK